MAINPVIIRSARRSLSLEVGISGQVILRAPEKIEDKFIDQFIQARQHWLEEKIDYFKKIRQTSPVRKFLPGEHFLYLGCEYELKLDPASVLALYFDQAFYLSSNLKSDVRQLFLSWYKNRAKKILQQRVEVNSQKLKLIAGKVRISNALRRWGSCGSKNSLNFNWRLIMAPLVVIDYVVIHELCHIRHKNHSKKFWQAVAEGIPDYQQLRQWLKANGHLLNI